MCVHLLYAITALVATVFYPPTLGFNFVYSHNRRIQYVSKALFGATNDITIAYNDNYPRHFMLCQVHNDRIFFRAFNRQGNVTFWRLRGEGGRGSFL